MRNTLVSIGLVVLILIGLAGLFYFFLIAMIGWIATILVKEYLEKHEVSPFHQLALQMAFALNTCASIAPFVMMPLGFGGNTPSELAGVTCVLFIPPLFGLLGFKLAREQGKNPIFLILVLSAIAGFSMFGILFLGNVFISDFHFQQLWVILLSVAGLLISTAIIEWLLRKRAITSPALLKYKHLFLVIITLMVIHYKAYDYMTWNFRKQLPFGTWDVHEWYWTDIFLPDYSYCLKAKMTEEEFMRYVAGQGLEQNPPDPAFAEGSKEYPRPNWGGPFESLAWWDVTTTMADSYYKWPSMDNYTVAKYENGYLYLYSSEW